MNKKLLVILPTSASFHEHGCNISFATGVARPTGGLGALEFFKTTCLKITYAILLKPKQDNII